MCNELILKSLIEVISKYRKIVIVSHVNPDGDALGSSLALYFFIKNLKQQKNSLFIARF